MARKKKPALKAGASSESGRRLPEWDNRDHDGNPAAEPAAPRLKRRTKKKTPRSTAEDEASAAKPTRRKKRRAPLRVVEAGEGPADSRESEGRSSDDRRRRGARDTDRDDAGTTRRPRRKKEAARADDTQQRDVPAGSTLSRLKKKKPAAKRRTPPSDLPAEEPAPPAEKAKKQRKRTPRGRSRGRRGERVNGDPVRPARDALDTKELSPRKYAPGEGKTDRRILIASRDDQESRVAVVAEKRLEELYVDKVGDDSYLGNIYLGKVVNLEPSIGAAFVDFGEGKNGFLHASDVNPVVHDDRVSDLIALGEGDGLDLSGRGDERKNIDELLSVGGHVVVQVTKDGIGHKGATLTTYISIPGCYLVLMPTLRRTGVSRKISDSDERRRLREILQALDHPGGLGFIIRTAGADHSRQDLERDAQFLIKMWKVITRRLKGAKAPATLYRETDLILRSLRDLFTPDTVEVIVDTERAFRRCQDFMNNVMPHYSARIKHHTKPKPLFTEFALDDEVEKVFQRKIGLVSGGSIVLDQAEALVAIDVNSGKNKEESDLEETALKTNVEAIPEIVRQLRLRDLGGLVIIDFIDMTQEKNRRRVERALRDELRKDRARFRMEGMSMFGIIELTRQRVRPSLFVAASATCPSCGGLGTVKSAESLAHTIVRRIRGEIARQRCAEMEVRLHPEMASFFQNTRRSVLLEMEETFEKVVRITPDPRLRYDDLRFAYHDHTHDLAAELEHYL